MTHLAQVAGFADHHYSVEKREVKGRTVAEIEELDASQSTEEIGRMLSGQKLTPEALRNAAEDVGRPVSSMRASDRARHRDAIACGSWTNARHKE